MESIWSKTQTKKTFPVLKENRTVQAVVIGGGMAGILTAFHLQKRGIQTIVLEAAEVGGRQTRNTTAKITSQHNLIYDKLITSFGKEKAKQYAAANEAAIQTYKRIVREEGIDCFFEERPAYLYSKNAKDREKLQREVSSALSLGISAEFAEWTELPFSTAGAVKFNHQAQFHPLHFLMALAEKLEIFEHTKVLSFEKQQVVTEHSIITADYIVFACHFPFVNFPGLYFARMHQERSYIIALQNAIPLTGMYLGIDTDALSFRSFQDLLLLGGGSHRTGENSMGGQYNFLSHKGKQLFPQSQEILRWSAQDCLTLDGVPYIGQFSHSTPDWYVATGFGKWGMTGSMVAAQLIADSITGKTNSNAEVFSPLRFTPAASVKKFCSGMKHSVKGIGRKVFFSPKQEWNQLSTGKGGIVQYKGEKVGAYRDEENHIYLVTVKCPHLGCQLEWNPDEKSWDCPCHGSRFDYKGKLLDNPAQTDLKGKTNGKEKSQEES